MDGRVIPDVSIRGTFVPLAIILPIYGKSELSDGIL